jgi:hypothetical protein
MARIISRSKFFAMTTEFPSIKPGAQRRGPSTNRRVGVEGWNFSSLELREAPKLAPRSMGMIGCFLAVTDEDLDAVVAEPSRIHVLRGREAPPEESFSIVRLFGGKGSSRASGEAWRPKQTPEEFDVDKAWQGIHFLLTGTDSEGNGPLAFILHGGVRIDEEMGYGPPHGFRSAEVKEIARALETISPEALFERADQEEFQEQSIYPEIWDEPKEECVGYVTRFFGELKQFTQHAADSNRALIVFIG